MATTRATERSEPGIVERVLLSIMGPAQVGDPDEPPHTVVIREDLCPTCGHAYSSHPVTRDPYLGSISQCPGPAHA